ncbi:MAG: ATP-grasp domain-containing protein [Acidobacteria bacterium]|nr:ATP-grasp domain-containing protein [Acidobacteriota bacterium]
MDYDAVSYTSNLENHPDILRKLAGRRKIIGNLPETVRSVRNWPAFFARLDQAGFLVPDSIFAGEKRKAEWHRQWLVKPVLSGGGHGVAFLRTNTLPCNRFFVQEYIPGKPCSASFVANGHECVVIGITEQLVGMHQFGSKDFGYCGNILPLPESLIPELGKTILEQVRRAAAFLVREYRLRGVNGIDFILNGDRVYLTEVNPRYSASMELIERAYKLPIFNLHAQSILDGLLPAFMLEAALNAGEFFGKSILYAEKNAIVPDTSGWFDRDIKDIPLSNERLRVGNPICTVLASRPTYQETLASLKRQAAMLKDEIYK